MIYNLKPKQRITEQRDRLEILKLKSDIIKIKFPIFNNFDGMFCYFCHFFLPLMGSFAILRTKNP